jgi:two-component system sensor histidine kinase KdpD
MARLESGTLKLKLDWNDISDLVYDSVHRLKTELVNHKVNIAVAKDIKLFKFDFGLMEQTLINIIHNSVIYTPDGSQIKIDVRKNIDDCIIKIADNGPGFPAESLPKLFHKFYRIPGSKTGGTGLGLSIAKGFIDAHKGSITAGNRSKGGACFTIKIPLLT